VRSTFSSNGIYITNISLPHSAPEEHDDKHNDHDEHNGAETDVHFVSSTRGWCGALYTLHLPFAGEINIRAL
jgi:hypothetical protein